MIRKRVKACVTKYYRELGLFTSLEGDYLKAVMKSLASSHTSEVLSSLEVFLDSDTGWDIRFETLTTFLNWTELLLPIILERG